MKVKIVSGGGPVGPMELGPVDTDALEGELGGRIERLVRTAFSELSPGESRSLPHPNEPWSEVVVDDSARAERLPGSAAQELKDLLLQSGQDWHRPLHRPTASPIFQHWVHSHEEDADRERVYRPRDFAFPPSRGREGFRIEESGAFLRHETGPTDLPVEVSGRWTIDRLRVDFDEQRPPTILEVGSYDDDMLRVRQVSEVDQESACSGWTAQLTAEPPGPGILRVEGTCTYVPGFSVHIRRHDPQGADPGQLLLDLTVVTPRPPWSGPTVVAVIYTMETERHYDTVKLLPEGVSIPVEHVV